MLGFARFVKLPAAALVVATATAGSAERISAETTLSGWLPPAPGQTSEFQLTLGDPAPAPAGSVSVDRQPSLPSTEAVVRPKLSFGDRAKAAKWEVGSIFAYMTVTQIAVTKGTRSFHFQDEGWFGKDTTNLGVDKLTHAFNSYALAEFLNWRISRTTGNARGSAATAAVLASGLMIYSELYDAHKKSSGFSVQDVIANTAGAAFSAARNTVPGLKEKLDFRLLLVPNSDVFTFKGKRHYEQQRYLLALQLAGFERLKEGPLRFFELQAGYRATGFTNPQRQRGELPRRSIFLGVGLNLNELFFRNARSGPSRVASQALNYLQLPYTAFYVDVTK
jgi:VanZ family protein